MHRDEDADIYLYNTDSGGTAHLYQTLIDSKQFNNVYNLDNPYISGNRITRQFSKVKRVWKGYKNCKFLKKTLKPYRIIYSYGSELECCLIYGLTAKLIKMTPQYINYEEGYGGYVYSCGNALQKYERILVQTVLHLNLMDYPNKMLFYLPQCISDRIIVPVEKMPAIKPDNIRTLQMVYNYHNTLNQKTIFFASGPNARKSNRQIANIIQQIGAEDAIIKPHPRFLDHFDGIENIRLMDSTNAPWEIICGSANDIDNMLLLGWFTTTLFTPKGVYGKEPYICFLFDIKELNAGTSLTSEKRNFVDSFIQTYSNPSKLMRPKSINELKNCIETWKLQVTSKKK